MSVVEDIEERQGFAPDWLRNLWANSRNGILTVIALFAIWAAAVSMLSIPEYLLPGPRQVVVSLWENRAFVLEHAIATGTIIVVGFAIAALVAIPMALMISFFTVVATTLYPTLVMVQNVPKIAVAPLFIIWFGFGMTPKLLVVFLLCFFPIVVGAIAGFKSISGEILDFARSTGANPLRVFQIIRFPAALPQVFVGLRIAATIAPTAAIVAEFVASDSGLGYLLLKYNGDLNTAMSFATILVLAAMGVALYFFIELIERFTIPWHSSVRGDEAST